MIFLCELHLIYKLSKGELTDFEKKALFKMIAKSSDRNSDGLGLFSENVYWRSPKKFDEVKKIFKAKLNEAEGHFILGHTRFATHGEINEENTHPFNLEHIVFLHNGVISTYDGENLPVGESDSKFIAEKLNDEYARIRNEIKAIKNVFTKIIGSLSVLIYFKQSGNLYYFKNSNGFHFALTDTNSIIASSDEDNIKEAISYKLFGFNLPYLKIVSELEPDDDKIYKISEAGIKEVGEVIVSTYYTTGRSGYYDKTSGSWIWNESVAREVDDDALENWEEEIDKVEEREIINAEQEVKNGCEFFREEHKSANVQTDFKNVKFNKEGNVIKKYAKKLADKRKDKVRKQKIRQKRR